MQRFGSEAVISLPGFWLGVTETTSENKIAEPSRASFVESKWIGMMGPTIEDNGLLI